MSGQYSYHVVQVVVSLPEGLALPSSTSARALPIIEPSWESTRMLPTSRTGLRSTGPPVLRTSMKRS